MQRVFKCGMSAVPLAIVGGLLYCAFFIKPTASGAAVQPPVVERGDLMYGVAVPGQQSVWAVGVDGKVWKSANAAGSWTLQDTPTQVNLQDIAVWSGQRAVAVGNNGVAIRTADGGLTWAAVQLPKSHIANKLIRVRVDGVTQAWAVGEAGAVFHSADLGATWSRMAPEEDIAWNDLHVDGKKIILVGEFGHIRCSEDGGTTWRDGVSPVKSSLMAVAFRNERDGMAVGLEGVMLTTGDGGQSWTLLKPVTKEHLFDVTWDGARWLAVGDHGAFVSVTGEGMGAQAKSLRDKSRAWHTRIAFDDHHYYMAGADFNVVTR
ncbi:Photosynthesis system II assembly factor YCF48 [Burkholderia sp. OK233]|nr:Photosynthesis system II assembly factor YCF48 [Burkholderia sp. OK233]